MTDFMELFATAPRGVEEVLAAELRALGAGRVSQARGGVRFEGDRELAYRVCLWSRCATRILRPLATFPAADGEALYAGARQIPWAELLAVDRTLAVEAATSRKSSMPGHFLAVRLKDAIVDALRDRHGERPSVDRKNPDVRIHVYLRGDRATVSLDLAGDALHRRGYRARNAPATLKENLAAAILAMAGYGRGPGSPPGPVVDPMCGSGTFLIEAAWIAGDVAPGLLRPRFGLEGLLDHDAALWDRLRTEARLRREAGLERLRTTRIVGYDSDARAIRASLENLREAGLDGLVHVERRELADGAPEPADGVGLVVTNPPYGDRMGQPREVEQLMRTLSATLRRCHPGWTAAVIAPPGMNARLGPQEGAEHPVYNGPIECTVRTFTVEPSRERPAPVEDAETEAFANRIRKNLKRLRKWARKAGVEAYRVYDADVPQFSLAVDRYGDWLHVQEYSPPATVDPVHAEGRLRGALAALPAATGVPAERIVFKERRRQRGSQQYERQSEAGVTLEVREGEHRFVVNLTDYLDTGLFLDHRLTRQRIAQMAAGRRVLNLFAYTGTATVYAAGGGATATTTVDMSNTYLDWARRNFELNGLDPARHRIVRADVLAWLDQDPGQRRHDLIFVDPPTFSNSAKMDGTFDIQRDHPALLRSCLRWLAPAGVILFSTNRRKFKLDREALADLECRDITDATIPEDFKVSDRARRAHRCYEVRRPDRG